jgi:ATP-dependent helicase/DNAse subunit B
MQQVIKISPLADLKLEIDFRQRGKLLHDAMAMVYRRIGSPEADPALADPDEFRRQFAGAVDELLAQSDDGGPLDAAWQAIDRHVLARWCDNYLQQVEGHAEKSGSARTAPRPALFEVSFGIASEAQAPSVAEPLVLAQGDERVQLRGRIDRIDTASQGGKTLVSVVDYKGSVGKKRSVNAAVEPTSLQADLYAVAASELILRDREAVPVAGGYWYLRQAGYVPAFAYGTDDEDNSFPSRRAELVDAILEIARGPRSGAFPVYSADDKCTGFCDFRTVCRVNQVRGLEKTWQAPQRGES